MQSGRSRGLNKDEMEELFCTYILISEKNGRYYIGHTADLAERLIAHNTGKVKSTHNKGLWKCVYFEKYSTKLEANRRELEIKKQKSRKYIEDLIFNNTRK